MPCSGSSSPACRDCGPPTGLVARGPEGRLGKVRLDAKLYRQAEQVLDEVKRLQAGGEPPKLTLNKHCQVCEFRQRCRKQAEQADDISLLGGVGEKELKRYNRKGIFTLTQLSCTFRPRKRGKRVKRSGYTRYPALQALAIREKKVHVYGTPDIPRKPVQVFLDAEGSEDGGFVYLLGVLVVEGESQKMHSFWADGPDQEAEAFDAFLDLLDGREDFALFHYGSYERTLLQADEEGGKADEARGPPACQRRERPVRHPRQRVLPHLLQRAEGRGPIPGLHLDGRESLPVSRAWCGGHAGSRPGISAGRTSC